MLFKSYCLAVLMMSANSFFPESHSHHSSFFKSTAFGSEHIEGEKLKQTLNYYDSNSEFYFERTMGISIDNHYSILTDVIDPDSKIMDLGCGSCRDSIFFSKKGYSVVPVDGSAGMAKIVKERLNIEVLVSEFKNLNFTEEFDAVWASASLLHSNDCQLKEIINVLNTSLRSKGYVYASFKYGEGEFVDKLGRYFKLQTEKSIAKLFSEDRGFEIVLAKKTPSVVNGVTTEWLHVLAQKIE